jgi:uncharacterized membrane protein YedE/YeeE
MDLGKLLTDGASGLIGGLAGGPFGMVAGLLSGIAPDLLPTFLPHLAGAQGQAVADAVIAVVSSATGTATPTPAIISGLSPDAKAALQVQLAQIALQAQQAAFADAQASREEELAQIQATLIDQQSARSFATTLASSHSALAYGSAIVSVVIVSAFGFTTWQVLSGHLSQSDQQFSSVLVGTLAAMATQVANYWLGSSSGSRGKDIALANSTPAYIQTGKLAASPKR